MTYERPSIEQRTEVGGPLIGFTVGSVPVSPTWRRSAYAKPAIEQRAEIGGPLVGIPAPSTPSPTWRRPAGPDHAA